MTFGHWILIAATPAELFALTQDYGRRPQWDPFLKSAQLLGSATDRARFHGESPADNVRLLVGTPGR
jgi:hypothetical protein